MARRISVPDFRLLHDKLLHQRLALFVLKHDDFHAAFLQIFLPADECLVLANDDALYLVQDACSGAHVARREGRVHRGAFVRGGGQSAGVLQSRHFGLDGRVSGTVKGVLRILVCIGGFSGTDVQYRAAVLDSHVVALAEDLAVFRHEACADWDAAFGGAFLALLKRGEESLVGL
jgi:hypothetical protein